MLERGFQIWFDWFDHFSVVNVAHSHPYSPHLNDGTFLEFDGTSPFDLYARHLVNTARVVLDNEPKLLFRLREHRRQIDPILAVQPKSILLCSDFGNGSLILVKTIRHFRAQLLLNRFYFNDGLSLVIVLKFLLSHEFASSIVAQTMLLKFFALEIEQAKGVLLPRSSLYVQAVSNSC